MKQVQVTAKSPTAFPRGVFYLKGLHCTVCSLRVFTHVEFLVLCFLCSLNVHIIPKEWFIFFHFEILGHMPKVKFARSSHFLIRVPAFEPLSQVMPHGQRSDEMHNVSGMMSSPVANQSGVNSSFSSTFMDETDDYMDYMGGGGSPLGLSSESSNQDRSCTSTPVGNDGSPAGELISVARRVI